MPSINASKTSHCSSPDKCISSSASNASLDETDIAGRANDNKNVSYVNLPSPSSTATTSTIDRPFKFRPSRVGNEYNVQSSSKRHFRHDKLFHLTHSLNRQYVIAMTNILFQMQKEIYKLKRRIYNVEHIFARQSLCNHPIIRIPRLTKDEISTICVNAKQSQRNVASKSCEESEFKNESQHTTTQSPDLTTDYQIEPESSISVGTTAENDTDRIHLRKQLNPKNKYCSRCQRDFSHRSAYLRHMRRRHQANFPTVFNMDHVSEVDYSHHEANAVMSNQSKISLELDNGIASDSLHTLVNQWDIGEGRLRPRPISKLNHEPISKIKCDICNKFYRAAYIKKHKRCTHHIKERISSNELSHIENQTKSNNSEIIDEIQIIDSESSNNHTNSPSAIAIADMDVDGMPIQFQKDINKPIVISVTRLELYQIEILDEFLRKFSPRVSQTASINTQTTHLITNDEKHALHSPVSMKLIEGIANHCFCVSYRWMIECIKYDRIVDESQYEIVGDDAECNLVGGPKRSRLTDKRHSLFDDICFMIKCTENSETKIRNDHLQGLITVCGGKIINCVTQSLLDRFQIVILCDKLFVSERRHNYDQCRSFGIRFVSTDWVLESIFEYRLRPFSSYEETPL